MNLSVVLKNKKGEGAISIILVIASIFLIVWFGSNMGFNFNVHIIYWLFGTNNMILLVPSTFSTNYGGILLLLFIIVIPFVIYFYFAIFDSCSENRVKERLIFLSSVILVFSIISSLLFLNFTIFSEDKIIKRSIVHIEGKEYSYDNVEKIQIYNTSGKGSTGLHYDIVMYDGTVININSLRYNVKNIKRYDKHTFNDLFYLDDKIRDDVPHLISTSAYKDLVGQGVIFPDNIKNKFGIR